MDLDLNPGLVDISCVTSGKLLDFSEVSLPKKEVHEAESLEKTQTLGKIEGRRRGQERMRWMDAITDSTDMNLGPAATTKRECISVPIHGTWLILQGVWSFSHLTPTSPSVLDRDAALVALWGRHIHIPYLA